jgi:hypothetical protein
MQFSLTGFTEIMGFRVFAFERVGEDRTRTQCTVKADLALARRFGIQLQELPLLCRGVLERTEAAGLTAALTFSEEAMQTYSHDCAAARDAARKKRSPRKPLGVNGGSAWRGFHPQHPVTNP